jgi:hypothetical protein
MALSSTAQSYLILGLALITFITVIVSVSINKTTQSADVRNNTLISQNTVFGFVIIALATVVYLSIGTSKTGATNATNATNAGSSPSVASVTPSFIKNTDRPTMIMLALLVTGIFTSFITTSINLATYDSITQKNIFMAQTIIFSVVILGLAFTISSVIGDDIMSKDTYLMMALHAAVLLSVVSLSANIMNKLAQATTAGAKVLTQ